MHITQLIKKGKPPVNSYQPGQKVKEITKKKKRLKAQPSEGRERSTLPQPTPPVRRDSLPLRKGETAQGQKVKPSLLSYPQQGTLHPIKSNTSLHKPFKRTR